MTVVGKRGVWQARRTPPTPQSRGWLRSPCLDPPVWSGGGVGQGNKLSTR